MNVFLICVLRTSYRAFRLWSDRVLFVHFLLSMGKGSTLSENSYVEILTGVLLLKYACCNTDMAKWMQKVVST